jgi:hypothetical protein
MAASETVSETVAETADLKSLARSVLRRGTMRDSERDALSRNGLVADANTRQQIEGVSLSRLPRGETPRQSAPPAYAPTFAALERQCPDHVAPNDWQQAIEDARRFLLRWGERASLLGWTARDLFGLHQASARPHPSYSRLSRYDCTGLVWLLGGRPVVALTEATAAIQGPTGAVTVYRRGPEGDSLDDLDPWGPR